MFNVDPVFSRPDFVVTVSGGTAEENSQMATAIGHAMNLCNFTNASIDQQHNTAPGYTDSCEVLNSMRMINPDLFESCIQVAGAPTEQMQAPSLLMPNFMAERWSQF